MAQEFTECRRKALKRGAREPAGPRDYTLFGRQDGMNSADCSDGFRNMAMTRDGKLWVATNQGLAMLPPLSNTTQPESARDLHAKDCGWKDG